MYPVLLTVHVICAVLLILIVLVQSGRSGGFSNIMGGGGGDALFSTSGQQSGFRKATAILAIIFMGTSLFLTFISNRSSVNTVFQKQFPNLPPVKSSTAEPIKDLPMAKPAAAPKSQTNPPAVPAQAKPADMNKSPVKK